jgi:hypothetical protein
MLFTGPAAGQAPYLQVPFGCIINAVNIASDGGLTLELWKKNAAIPTVSDSISTNGFVYTSGATRFTTLTDLSTRIVAPNDYIAFNLFSVTGTPAFVSVNLECQQCGCCW